ncbi:MAG: GNAT family N-acetyltransferase [Candidatus Sericytochromatia bacterium]
MEKTSPPEQLSSTRLVLKKHNSELAEVMFAYVDGDRERLGQFLPWVAQTRSVFDEINYIALTHRLWENHEMFDYGLFRKSDGRYLGNLGVHSLAWSHARCELGYWILSEFEGQGYVTEAVAALEASLFGLGFNRIEIRCSDLNTRSGGVPERLGYQLEGVLRQQSFEMGAFRDTRIYARLQSEFQAQLSPAWLPDSDG